MISLTCSSWRKKPSPKSGLEDVGLASEDLNGSLVSQTAASMVSIANKVHPVVVNGLSKGIIYSSHASEDLIPAENVILASSKPVEASNTQPNTDIEPKNLKQFLKAHNLQLSLIAKLLQLRNSPKLLPGPVATQT